MWSDSHSRRVSFRGEAAEESRADREGEDSDGEAADAGDVDDAEEEAADGVEVARSLLLQRTQSDRFGSPMRLSASPQGFQPPPLSASSNSPASHPRVSLSPPPLLMSAYGRRASESDAAHSAAIAADADLAEPHSTARDAATSAFAATTSALPSLPPSASSLSPVHALSSWTGASLDPLYTSPSSLLSEAQLAPPLLPSMTAGSPHSFGAQPPSPPPCPPPSSHCRPPSSLAWLFCSCSTLRFGQVTPLSWWTMCCPSSTR